MYSEERFHEVERQTFQNTEQYGSKHPNGEKARTLLITAVELSKIQDHVHLNYVDVIDERHQYQDIFYSKGLNAAFSLYWLLKHGFFDAAYREVRFLFECYLVIKGLNRDQEATARIFDAHREEIKGLDPDLDEVERAMYPYESVEELHRILREEKNQLKERDPVYGDIYNFLSNRSSHPVRIEGAMLDGKGSVNEEDHLLNWGIVLAFGLSRQFLKTYMETAARSDIVELNQPIVNQFDKVMGSGVPEFLADPY